jgi:hypothetical protein
VLSLPVGDLGASFGRPFSLEPESPEPTAGGTVLEMLLISPVNLTSSDNLEPSSGQNLIVGSKASPQAGHCLAVTFGVLSLSGINIENS